MLTWTCPFLSESLELCHRAQEEHCAQEKHHLRVVDLHEMKSLFASQCVQEEHPSSFISLHVQEERYSLFAGLYDQQEHYSSFVGLWSQEEHHSPFVSFRSKGSLFASLHSPLVKLTLPL